MLRKSKGTSLCEYTLQAIDISHLNNIWVKWKIMYKLDDIEEEPTPTTLRKNSNYSTKFSECQTGEPVTISVFMKTLIKESKEMKKHFHFDKFLEGFFFRFALPLYDIISDFLLASTLSSDEYKSDPFLSKFCTFFCYYCITLPGLMFQARNCKRMLPKKFVKLSNFTLTLMTCFLFFVVYPNFSPTILMPTAILISIVLLAIGLMSMFVHGPNMITFADNTTGYEGRFESAPQLILQIFLLMKYRSCFYRSYQGRR